MAKLTDTQLVVLSKAVSREDGVAVVPAKMNKAAAAKVGSSLVARKLMREVRSKPGIPVWREDEDGRSISPMITRAGRDAIGVEGEAAPEEKRPAKKRAGQSDAPVLQKPSPVNAGGSADRRNAALRGGTKQALVISMLSGKAGATLDALVDATGWLPHTTRAALTGLRKRGFAIERTRVDGEESIYRIVSAPAAAAA